ncbi:cysteine hydrolase family protein [Sedimentimonas flavescens]|uniref:cysteine hydrolase family protein n=1 Tax=Sedimentimonas flavescens TaxID=2851012 RepID=UPI0021A9553B|nr:cysteine hydrolase [Sedimentimonas flavescens]MCT2539631.1 cysteine hydrolase [Sedimentimonas flavescens]WBL33130.1 cysteine hydrolase [Sinirhodobacter sp. HNIBRBA609]
MTLGIVLGIVALVLTLWLGNGVRRIGSVSVGETIRNRDASALLLIDLQSVFWERGPYSDAAKEGAAAVIYKEVEAARAQNHPVIAVRQEWSIPSTKAVARLTMKGQAIEGSDGTDLAEPFSSLPDQIVVKRVQDAFETGELDALLERLDVGKLRLVGLDFNYCVQKTALAARNRGYDVTVVRDGTLSAAPTEGAEKRMSSAGVAIR